MTAGPAHEALEQIRAAGLWKHEQVLSSPQGHRVSSRGRSLVNMCANDYLGLAADPRLVAAAREALDRWGFGMASVRFICGTTELHQELEDRLARFLGTEAAILFSSCFDANTGLFEALLSDADAIVSDALNHASIIDGIRLSKARTYRYRNGDVTDAERAVLEARAAGARQVLLATDGVFSMDGHLAPLPALRQLADEQDCLLLVDDSHAVGFLGRTGAGTPESLGVHRQVDLLTGTFGKALGGASGGYVAGSHHHVELLRQRARPYLFSNALAPSVVAATLAALDIVATEPERRDRLAENTTWWRTALAEIGLDVIPGAHPIVPVMLGEAPRASSMADRVVEQGVLVVSFSHPVVPHGMARIRTQVSAAHSRADLEAARDAFATAAQCGH